MTLDVVERHLDAQDRSAVPYLLSLVDPDVEFPDDFVEAVISLVGKRAVGTVHVLGEQHRVVATLRWARATNRELLLGPSSSHRDHFDEVWIRLAALASS